MQMIQSNRQAYPQLAQYVQTYLAQVAQQQRLVELLCEFGHCTAEQIRDALAWGTYPWLDVRDLEGLGHNGFPANGVFDPNLRMRIALSEELAWRFENDSQRPEARELISATVLHELVHWADYLDGALDDTLGDRGRLFEIAAFGEVVPTWWHDEPSTVARAHTDALKVTLPDAALWVPMTGRIGPGTSYWGKDIRKSVNGAKRSHFGWDIYASLETPVLAVASGTVVSGWRYRKGGQYLAQVNNYGQMIDIDHGNGLVSRYAHLHTVEVAEGARVTQGELIGTMGATGTQYGRWLHLGRRPPGPPDGATPPHLHFELRKANAPSFSVFEATLDPALFFDFVGRGSLARSAKLVAQTPGVHLASLQPLFA